MKSNVSGKKSNSEIILSIGMIVKNEEKVLERCLKSLLPLMKAIPSELIIADTGSTDSTIEIARKYTDNVFHFEWINDFAAARNSTLEKAKGQWYLFIDADEYFDEDIGEIVHFFNIPELRNKYRTLEVMLRSYTDEEKQHYQDSQLARFQRIDEEESDIPIKFVGAIHETMYLRYPLGYFSTIVHHTGYCYTSTQKSYDKKNRNLKIMREEYQKSPDDLRLICHLIDGSGFNIAEQEQYVNAALELARKNRTHMYGNVAYMLAVWFYSESKPEYSLELIDEYENTLESSESYVGTIPIYVYKAKILSSLARYEEASKVIYKYIKLYKDYKDDKLNMTDVMAHPLAGLSERDYLKNIYMLVLCLQKQHLYEKAFNILDEIDLYELQNEDFREFLGTLRSVCVEKEDYVYLAKYYNLINNMDKNSQNYIEKKNLSLYMMENVYYSIVNDERIKFANDIVSLQLKGPYFELMQLVIDDYNGINITEALQTFVGTIDNWDDGFSEAIYLAVKKNIDISGIVNKIETDHIRVMLELISKYHDEFSGYVLKYTAYDGFFNNIKQFYWLVALYEKASYNCYSLNDEEKNTLYIKFITVLGEYVRNIYNPELLNDDDIEVLPKLHKFGYFMNNAQNAYSQGDKVKYVREMRKALNNCESMKEIVQFMIEYFKKNLL